MIVRAYHGAAVLSAILSISSAAAAEEPQGCPIASYVAVSAQDEAVFSAQGLMVGGPGHSGDWRQGFLALKDMFADIEMRYALLAEPELPTALLRGAIDIAVTSCDRVKADPEGFFSLFEGLNVWLLRFNEEPRRTTLAEYGTGKTPSSSAAAAEEPQGCPLSSYIAVSAQDESVFSAQELNVGGPRDSPAWNAGFTALTHMFPEIGMRYTPLGKPELPAALSRSVIDIAVTSCENVMLDPQGFFSHFEGLNVWVLRFNQEPRRTTLAEYGAGEKESLAALVLHVPAADWRLEDRSLVSEGYETYLVLDCETPGELLLIGGGKIDLNAESLPSRDEGDAVQIDSFVSIDYMKEGLRITSTVEDRPALLLVHSDYVSMVVPLDPEDLDKFVTSRGVLVKPTIFRQSEDGLLLTQELMKAAGTISYHYRASTRLPEAMHREFRALCFE